MTSTLIPARPETTPSAPSALHPGEELVDTAFVPDGTRLRLVRHGDDFAILLDQNELMSTDLFASEQALASLVCARLRPCPAMQLLIGGYGMGFTLRAALAEAEADAEITVAEIVPKVLEWARGPMQAITAGCLDDPRVRLIEDDVSVLIEAARDAYDAILLDVDNGPEGLTRGLNDWLYSPAGLASAWQALRPGGILALWSASPDDRFAGRLARSGFAVSVLPIKAGLDRDDGQDSPLEHVIMLAEKILPGR